MLCNKYVLSWDLVLSLNLFVWLGIAMQINGGTVTDQILTNCRSTDLCLGLLILYINYTF